jgi:hypothetical protein
MAILAQIKGSARGFLILRSGVSAVSKDGRDVEPILRDAAKRPLLRMRRRQAPTPSP